MRDQDLIRTLKIEARVLESWVEQGWLRRTSGADAFTETDLARARLILDLSRSLGVNEAGIDIAISLIDQMHGMRVTMRTMLELMDRQDQDMRRRLFGDVIDLD